MIDTLTANSSAALMPFSAVLQRDAVNIKTMMTKSSESPQAAPATGSLVREARCEALITEIAAKLLVEEPKLAPLVSVKAGSWLAKVYPPPDQVIGGALDRGTKFAIIGSSKAGKTWFALQMCLCIAAGRKFLSWDIPKPRKVLLINLEIPEAHMQGRIRKVATGLGLSCLEADNLEVLNTRSRAGDILRMQRASGGITAEWTPEFIDMVKSLGVEVILFDPLYKLTSAGDENKAEDIKPVLHQFDVLAEMTGAAVGYVHHCAKGQPGDRHAIDRGAGSGVLARDYDACFNLTRHADDEISVLESVIRAYRGTDPQSIRRNPDSCVFELDEAPAVVMTTASKNRQIKKVIDPEKARLAALEILANGPVLAPVFNDALGNALRVGVNKTAVECRKLEADGVVVHRRWADRCFWVATPEQNQAATPTPRKHPSPPWTPPPPRA